MISIRKKNHAMNFIVTVLSSVFLLKSYCILLLQNQSILMRRSSQRSFNTLFSNLNPWILLTLKEGEGCTLWEYNKDQGAIQRGDCGYKKMTSTSQGDEPVTDPSLLAHRRNQNVFDSSNPNLYKCEKIIFYCSCHPKCTWWTVIISL